MYRVITYPEPLEQLEALPAEALTAYAEAFGVLELAPMNGRFYNEAKPDGLRELVFGDQGEGTVTYLILEWQREVHVVLVQWIG
ncbi:MAG: hypothetical protein GEU86_16695 [Actinophytocola sp.]|nr:hypothetical protein [Actinophytocola sp.]